MCVQKTSNGLFHVLDSSQCIEDEKPDSQETCTKDHCGTMWFMTDWSEVSSIFWIGKFYIPYTCLLILSCTDQVTACKTGMKSWFI